MFAILIHHLIDPVSIAILVLIGALIAEHYGRRVLARGLVAGTALVLIACSLLPIDALLAKPLEDQYPRAALPAQVDGIVILSGGLRVTIVESRGGISNNVTVTRMAAAAELAQRYPKARLIFSGTTSTSEQMRTIECAEAEQFFRSIGIAPGRMIYERRSRDTWENLVNSKQIAKPKPGETWLLVTSALHMPRAMGVARRLDWPMLAWPTDYDTSDDLRGQPYGFASARLMTMTFALHEWIGIMAYEIEGRMR